MYNNDLPTRADLPSSKQLLRSTLMAVLIAAVLLVTVVLPAEYGVDPTGLGRVLGLAQMGEIKQTLAAEAKKDREATSAPTNAGKTQPTAPPPNNASAAPSPEKNAGVAKSDEMTVTLKPGQGVEIKLEMVKGAEVTYRWAASGGALNHDTHGDNAQKAFISYRKGTGVSTDAGELIAAFDGSHGWFWRNRTDQEVTVTLKTSGTYQSIKRVA